MSYPVEESVLGRNTHHKAWVSFEDKMILVSKYTENYWVYCTLPNTTLAVWVVKTELPSSASPCSLADNRVETCFLRYDDEECTLPISGRHRMDACCCSVGAAWGTEECEECPVKNTPEYEELCPRGPGFATKEITNGKPFFKGTMVSVVDCSSFQADRCISMSLESADGITVNIINAAILPSSQHTFAAFRTPCHQTFTL